MSGATHGNQNTSKAIVSDSKDGSRPLDGSGNKVPAAQLEEDDEFEDFPVEGTVASLYADYPMTGICHDPISCRTISCPMAT